MILFDHRDGLPENLQGAVIALGNIDGFHRGHQSVVGEAVTWARSQGRPAIVATFDPHPVRHFAPQVQNFRLTTLEQRAELFSAAGVDATLVFHFDEALAAMSAESFINELLGQKLGAHGIVTGDDFTFGKARGGNTAVLAEVGARYGIEARAMPAVSDDGSPISSSRIRDALLAGDCALAARLLTRPYTIRGTVIHGDKIGRTIGFPTANMDMGEYLRPHYGIYAVTGRVLETGEVLKGAANLGIRPTFDPPKELLEPYFFDFAGDLYGKTIDLSLHAFLRPEMKFTQMDALIAQMDDDCARARQLLG